jgi:AcrR family transcriptional regulator
MSTPETDLTAGQTMATRSRLIAAAAELFYAAGIGAVPVEQVIERAGVTRSTFYRYFPAKDDLVVAYLTDRDQQIRATFEHAAAAATSPEQLLNLVVTQIGHEICGSGFRGCPFINAAVEYPDASSPIRRAADAHRTWFTDSLTQLLTTAGHPTPAVAARGLTLLRDGAMVGGYLNPAAEVDTALKWSASQLLGH